MKQGRKEGREGRREDRNKNLTSSRKRKFSVGTKPAKKILIPSRTENGIVTTPYAEGVPYKQQM